MKRKLLLLLGLALVLILPSCEMDDSPSKDFLLSQGWEFYDVIATSGTRDMTYAVISQYQNEFGLIYAFEEDGSYSIDDDNIHESGWYEFDNQTLVLKLDGKAYDAAISETLMVLSYVDIVDGRTSTVKLYFR